MVINEKIKAMADKYIDDVYENSEIQYFEISPEIENLMESVENKLIPKNLSAKEQTEREMALFCCTRAYLEQGIYYGLLHASEILKAANELQEATR